MLELISLYSTTLIAGPLVAAALALIGTQLAGRGQSTQILVISQGSSLGVTCGLALSAFLIGDHLAIPWIPLVCALFFSGGFYIVCERSSLDASSSRNTLYIGLFALLLSTTHAVTAVVPSLESHMAASFFGDLAVVSESAARSMAVLGFLAIILLLANWRRLSQHSFDLAIFGQVLTRTREKNLDRVFIGLSLLMLSLSVQHMGLLFSISSLFLPSLAVSYFSRGLRQYTSFVVAVASVGCVSGFLLSLWHERLPTVPTIALVYVCLGFLLSLFTRLRPRHP